MNTSWEWIEEEKEKEITFIEKPDHHITSYIIHCLMKWLKHKKSLWWCLSTAAWDEKIVQGVKREKERSDEG